PPTVANGPDGAGKTMLSTPSSLLHFLSLQRLDYAPRNGQRVMGRIAISRVERPDFIWSPYKDFISPLTDNALGLAIAWIAPLNAGLTNEARIGWTSSDLRFERAHPEVPVLVSTAWLPGSPSSYGYRNRSRNWELGDNLTGINGRHIWKIGGGFL